jgi:hypothetical protein
MKTRKTGPKLGLEESHEWSWSDANRLGDHVQRKIFVTASTTWSNAIKGWSMNR